jgi:hypothetical protein
MVLCTSLGACEAGGVGRGCVAGACIPLICCCCFGSSHNLSVFILPNLHELFPDLLC